MIGHAFSVVNPTLLIYTHSVLVKQENFLGGLAKPIISEEDQPTVKWQDPFRMSVLDFQQRAMDKLAGVLKVFVRYAAEGPLKGSITPPDKDGENRLEDLSSLLRHIKDHKDKYVQLLPMFGKQDNLTPAEAIDKKHHQLTTARNYTAHQAYIKDSITPSCNPSESKDYLSSGCIPLAKTKTFEHTEKVISISREYANEVFEGMKFEEQPVSCGYLGSVEWNS